MNEREKLALSEKAQEMYVDGKTYKEISVEIEVPVNTLKSWRKRYQWERVQPNKKGCVAQRVQQLGNILRNEIKKDLLQQLSINDTEEKRYIDLVEDYMALWDIKNRLIQDIKERGVSVEWNNGKQTGRKKNDSVADLVKVNNQMLKILSELGLKPSPKVDSDYDEI